LHNFGLWAGIFIFLLKIQLLMIAVDWIWKDFYNGNRPRRQFGGIHTGYHTHFYLFLFIYSLSVGLVPRAVNYLMESLQGRYGMLEASGTGKTPVSGPFFEIYTSFLEIYNEDIVDLLAPLEGHDTRSGASKRKSGFSIREDAKGDIYLTGIREEKIVCGDEIFALLQKGSLSRTTKSTEMNMVSSRSHAIFTLLLRQRSEEGARVLTSKLHFVDLAGSERLKRTQAQGARVKESISINSGLLALGNVISALGDPHKRSTHIPYRNSKLTRLLQDSLGGNSQTLMIACASPSSDNFSESLNTLKYADRAKNIQNSVQVNEETGGSGAFEVAQLKKQVAALKQEILHLRTARRSESSADLSSASSDNFMGGVSSARPASASSSASTQAEMTRLRGQNAELKRRLTQMCKEKATLEAERDLFKTALGPAASKTPNLKLISELRGRIAELEASNSFTSATAKTNTTAQTTVNANSNSVAAPQTPVWLRQANVLVNKARDEIRDNLQTIRKIEFDAISIPSNHDHDNSDNHQMCIDEDDAPRTPSKSNSSSSAAMLQLSHSQNSLTAPHHQNQSQSHGVLQLTQAQFAAAVANRCEKLMSRVRSDLNVKEDLIRQFEICQAEYSSMRRNYDEKIRLVQENLAQAQKERDLAIKKATSAASSTPAAPTISLSNRRYEERIKALGKELNIARASVSEAQRAMQTRSFASESSLKSLRTQLEAMRAERTKLLARINDETSRLRNDCFAHDQEISELRQREYRANESVRKLKKACDFQKALLQKRIEQNHQSRAKIRQLLLALKKRSNGSFSLEDFENSDFMDEEPGSSQSSMNIKKNKNNEQDQEQDEQEQEDDNDIINSPNENVSNEITNNSDEEVFLQLNEQTEAVLNDEITMMDIDTAPPPSNSSSTKSPSSFMAIDSPTGEMPRSALRHSPLISRRRDVFAKLDENKRTNPFK
jgi:hypothetical protein